MKSVINIKVMAFSLMALMSIGMFTSCSNDDDTNNGEGGGSPSGGSEPTPEVFHPINASTRTLINVVEKNEYTSTEFREAIVNWPMLSYAGDAISALIKPALRLVYARRVTQLDDVFRKTVGTGYLGARQWNIKRYVFTYKSISSVTGNDTTLVGSVIFPTNTLGKPHQVEVLSLYHHQAFFDNSWLASHSVTLMGMHALNNFAVIEPDGQGASLDAGKLTEENMRGDWVALQMADCMLAALEVMRQEGVTVAENGYTNNWGTSIGTVGTTGFAQYMENNATPDLQALFNLRATYIGEGPTMLRHLRGAEDMMPDLPAQKFYDGWNPRLPFYISCAPNDEFINYDELKNYYTKLQTMPDGTVNNNVQWLDFNMSPTEKAIAAIGFSGIEGLSDCNNHLYSATLTLLYICMAKDPEHMKMFLKQNK